MAPFHSHQHPIEHRNQAQWPHYLVTQGRWNEPYPPTLRCRIVMTGIGLALLAGGIVMALSAVPSYGVLLLFFLSSPFLLYGGILLLFAPAAGMLRRLRRIRNHCGRCRFYQPLDGQYALGRCRADPNEGEVHRKAGCPFFSYSERAMVRDRFAQRAEMMQHFHEMMS